MRLIPILFALAQSATPQQKTREVLDLWIAGKYEAIHAMFDSTMRKFPVATYRQQSEQIKALGVLNKIGDPILQNHGGYSTVVIRLDYPSTALNFSVSWNKNGEIAGTYFRPAVKAAAVEWKSPEYSKPDSFTGVDLTIGDDKWKLPATLTIPKGDGPFPALVLVHGSGPNDRDESIGGAKVFRDLAQGLSSRGIAVLRYKKRTLEYPQECAADPNFTMTTETVDDALRAAALLRKRAKIDPARVFVLGHSQGGYMMPRIMQRDPKLAGVVIMAGNVRPLEELIVEQMEYLARLERIKKDPLSAFHLPEQYLVDLKDYHPDAELKKIGMPVLVLQGERDYQVTMKDFALWRAAMEGRSNAVFHSYERLNHLFIAGEGKSNPAEYQKPGHVDLQVIDDIANWIRSRGI